MPQNRLSLRPIYLHIGLIIHRHEVSFKPKRAKNQEKEVIVHNGMHSRGRGRIPVSDPPKGTFADLPRRLRHTGATTGRGNLRRICRTHSGATVRGSPRTGGRLPGTNAVRGRHIRDPQPSAVRPSWNKCCSRKAHT